MLRHMFISAGVLFCLSGYAIAQQSTPPRMYLPSSEPDMKKLLADREEFVKEYYQPDADSLAKLNKSMSEEIPFHEKYQKDTALTISRISLAMGIISEPGLNDDDRTTRLNRFSEQVGRIYARAPLSLANAAKKIEAMLPPEKVAAGRAKMSGQLTSRLQGEPLDLSKLDVYFSPPPPMTPRPIIARPSFDPQTYSNREPTSAIPMSDPSQTPPAPPVKASPPAEKAPQATVQNPPVIQQVPPPTPVPAPPPPPPPVVKVAPPKESWLKHAEDIRTKYGFNDEQQKVAESIVKSVMGRVETVGTTKDASGNEPIDVLYDEMIQRLDSIATIEQRQRANPATTATPTPTTQPSGR